MNEENHIKEFDDCVLPQMETEEESTESIEVEEYSSSEPIETQQKSFNDLHPFDQLKILASHSGVRIKEEPEADCPKCGGAGYTGFTEVGEHKLPMACECVLHEEDRGKLLDPVSGNSRRLNRAERRKLERRSRISQNKLRNKAKTNERKSK